MKKIAGRHPQSWCEKRFTHVLCSGFRYDNAVTLNKIGIDFPESEGRIEILCSCSCHREGNQFTVATDDPIRFQSAVIYTKRIFGEYLE